MPSVSSTVTMASVSPTLRRRGAQASRGRANSVSKIGVAISTPSRSPIHQMPQLSGSDAVERPRSHSAAVVSVALIRHDTTDAPRKADTSRGSTSVSGCCTKRRTSHAPAHACKVAPSAIVAGIAQVDGSSCGPCRPARMLVANAASAMPISMRGPYISTQASAMPAAGYSGVTKPGGIASRSDTAATTKYPIVVAASAATQGPERGGFGVCKVVGVNGGLRA